MTTNIKSFINKLDALLSGVDGSIESTLSQLAPTEKVIDPKKIDQIIQNAFRDCSTFIEEQENRILKDIKVSKEIGSLEKEASNISTFAKSIQEIAESNLSRSFNRDCELAIRSINEKKKEIDAAIESRIALKSLLDTDSSFKNGWETLTLVEQQAFLERFEKNHTTFDTCKDPVKQKQVIKTAFKMMFETRFFTRAGGFSHIFVFWASTKGLNTILPIFNSCLESLFRVKPANRDELLKIIYIYLQDYNTAIRLIPEIEALSKLPTFDSKLLIKHISLTSFYAKEPEAFLRYHRFLETSPVDLSSLENNLHSYYDHAGPNAGRNLMDILEKFGSEGAIAINTLFKYTNKNMGEYRHLFTPANAPKLAIFFEWVNEQITANSTPENKKKVIAVLDRMIVLFLDRPIMAEDLLKLPKNSFSQLFTILNRDDILNLTPESVTEALTKEGEVKLASSLFDKSLDVEAKVKELSLQVPELEKIFNTWLETVLKFSVTPPLKNLSDKIKALPTQYQALLIQMISFSENRGKVLVALLNFGIQVPHSQPLAKLFENLTKFINEFREYEIESNLFPVINEVTLLVNTFPDAIPQILSLEINNIPNVVDLSKENKLLCHGLLKRHPEFLKDNINTPELEDKNIQQGLLRYLKIEKEHNISLIEMFQKALKRIISVTLQNYIRKDPDLGLQIAHVIKYGQLNVHLPLVIDSLKKYPDQTIAIFKSLSQFPLLCIQELRTLASNSGKNSPLMDLNASPYPVDLKKVAFLISSGETPLAEQILAIYAEDMAEAHIILDTAYALYFAEAKEMIQKIHDEGPLKLEILSLAARGEYDLLSKVLKLNPKEDHLLIQILLENSNEGTPPLFTNLMSLRARGEEDLVKMILEIKAKPSSNREPYMQAALEAVEKGYFLFARELLKKKTIPQEISWDILKKLGDFTKDWAKIKSSATDENKKLFEENLLPFVEKLCSDSTNTTKLPKWIATLQFLLQHNPGKLFTILSGKNWQNIDDVALWDITNDINVLLKIDHTQKRNQTLTQLSLGLANCLLTPAGTINTNLIPLLQDNANIQCLQALPYEGKYLTRVLRSLKHSDFNERLQLLNQIPYPSRQQVLIANMLNLSENQPIDARSARMAILSTLLCPLRQGNSGSCFGTSIAIKNASTEDGLKQMLEDLMSLAIHGSIRRHYTVPNKGTSEYPLVIGTKASTARFAGDNLFARSYEYTLASMGAYNTDLKNNLLKSWETNLRYKIAEAFSSKKGIDSENLKRRGDPVYNAINAELQQQFAKSCTIIFNGYAQHPSENQVGAWLIIDSETGERLDEEGIALKFYTKVFASTRNNLKQKMPAEEDLFKNIFDECLLGHVQSYEFAKGFYKLPDERNVKGLLLVNPIKYSHQRLTSPFTQFSGGFPDILLKNLHGSNPVKMAPVPNRNPFQTFADTLQYLSDAELSQTSSCPSKLLTAQVSDHAFNFRLAEAIDLFSKHKVGELWESHKKDLEAIEKTPLTKEMTEFIIKSFLKANRKDIQTQLEKTLEGELKQCKTIKELVASLRAVYHRVTGNRNPDKDIDDAVESATRDLPAFKGKFPKIYPMYDLNWAGVEQFGFGLSLFDHQLKRIYPAPKDQNYVVKWNPGDPSSISSFKIRDSASDYTRHYLEINM